MFDKISTALLALFSPANVPKVQSRYDYEASKLDGYPALTLVPSASENEYSTTTENRRVYAFTVRLYVQRPNTQDGEKACEKTMRDLVDDVVDAVDSTASLDVEARTGYTFLFMSASPSKWGYTGHEPNVRVAEILVRVHYDVDTTAI